MVKSLLLPVDAIHHHGFLRIGFNTIYTSIGGLTLPDGKVEALKKFSELRIYTGRVFHEFLV